MQFSAYRSARRKLIEYGLYPKSAFAQITVYLAVVELLLYVLRLVLRAANRSGAASALNGWISFLGFAVVVLLVVVGLRWFRRVVMWRLRNRLIVTSIFIGVIPLALLATIALGAAYLFSGQFATYIATDELHTQVGRLDTANRAIAGQVAMRVTRGESLETIARDPRIEGRLFPRRSLVALGGDKPVVLQGQPVTVPAWLRGRDFSGLVEDGALYLRAATTVDVHGRPLMVVSSVPVNTELLNTIASGFSEVGISYSETPAADVRRSTGRQPPIVYTNPENKQVAVQFGKDTLVAGTVPPATGRLDVPIKFLASYPYTAWGKGPEEGRQPLIAVMYVATRPSALLARVTQTSGFFGGAVVDALIAVAILFGIIELFALGIGIRLTRTVTRSVAQLYAATQHINRGDLSHRIVVKNKDQLAALEGSFNSMTESLQKLLAEQREKQRLENELAIAQEVQAQLFPQRPSEMAAIEVQGVCQPARVVSGDYFDFLPFGEDKLAIAVGDISGKGISAALLMATIHSAVRAYEFGHMPQPRELVTASAATLLAGVPTTARALPGPEAMESPAAVLWMLNRHLYHSTPMEKYATLFLGIYDGATRRLTYSNAGHLPPLLLGRDGSLRKLTEGGTVIGLFEGPTWEEETVQLEPGDLFIAYSDGITEPENEFGEFGEERLLEMIRKSQEQPLERIAGQVVAAVNDWIGGEEQPDDITIVLARAR